MAKISLHANAVAQKQFTPLIPGEYSSVLTGIRFAVPKGKTKNILTLTFKITDKSAAYGRSINCNLSLTDPSERLYAMSVQKFINLCDCLQINGADLVDDEYGILPEDLHLFLGKKILITVKQISKDGAEFHVVDSFATLNKNVTQEQQRMPLENAQTKEGYNDPPIRHPFEDDDIPF